MKKLAASLFLAAMLGSIGYLARIIFHTIEQNKQAALNRDTIPEFTLQTLTGEIFTKQDLPTNKPSLIIYFSPDCQHCHYEASVIRDSIQRLSDISILWVSQASKETLRNFAEEYDLTNYSNIFILQDQGNAFKRLMAITISPAILIYNEEQKLITLFKGETKIDTILKYLGDRE